MKIAVEIPGRFADAGDYLADARAFDSAGVDSLWLSDGELDPWLVLAGIAAVTGRARLAIPVSARDRTTGDALARRMSTLDRLSRGRALAIVIPTDEPGGDEAHVRRIAPTPVLLQGLGDGHAIAAARLADGLVIAAGPTQCHAAFDQPRRRCEQERLTAPFELWTRASAPRGREHWKVVLKAAAAAGATGVLLPSDPRLLDLLRNPDEEDDRSDLTLAQG